MVRQSSSGVRLSKGVDLLSSSLKSIRTRISGYNPKIGIVLGSGLGSFGDLLADIVAIPYAEIEGFPVSRVEGHEGRLLLGFLKDKDLIVMQGRLHLYEGYNVTDLVYPIRVLSGLGISVLILTNAAGGIKKGLFPGDIMVLKDHINLTGENPLIGIEPTLRGGKSPFIDMTSVYDPGLIGLAISAGNKAGIKVSRGVLAAVKGPSYETQAEIKALKRLGADAVCMSTIHEVIMARYLEMRILGISLVTNYAADISAERLTHQSVLEIAEKNRERFSRLITAIVEGIEV